MNSLLFNFRALNPFTPNPFFSSLLHLFNLYIGIIAIIYLVRLSTSRDLVVSPSGVGKGVYSPFLNPMLSQERKNVKVFQPRASEREHWVTIFVIPASLPPLLSATARADA